MKKMSQVRVKWTSRRAWQSPSWGGNLLSFQRSGHPLGSCERCPGWGSMPIMGNRVSPSNSVTEFHSRKFHLDLFPHFTDEKTKAHATKELAKVMKPDGNQSKRVSVPGNWWASPDTVLRERHEWVSFPGTLQGGRSVQRHQGRSGARLWCNQRACSEIKCEFQSQLH